MLQAINNTYVSGQKNIKAHFRASLNYDANRNVIGTHFGLLMLL